MLRITFGRLRYSWPHPYKWTESNRCICVRLTTCKKPTAYLQQVFSNQLHTYVHLGMSNHTQLKWLKKILLLLILYHMQKTNFITQFILKIKLTNYSSSLCAYPGMPDHTHLKQPTSICCFHGPLVTSRNSTSTYLWDILV